MSAAKKQRTSGADGAEVGPSSSMYSDKDPVQPLLKLFYERLFPTEEFYTWLSYGNNNAAHGDATFFQRREFCFTLENDVFVRYQSFKDGKALRAALTKDASRVPAKIDIGPVFNVDPQKRAAYSSLGSDRVFAPVERELVFDVDMTDYDDVRSCCTGGAICAKCWPYMTIAVRVVDAALRDDFGFRHVMWVYSGRRGVHCWVCDPAARRLTNEQRTSVAEYLTVGKTSEKSDKKIVQFPLHPSLARAYNEVLLPMWLNTILPAQKLLETEKKVDALLAMIPDEGSRAALAERLKSGKRLSGANCTSKEEAAARWGLVQSTVEKAVRKVNKHDLALTAALEQCCQSIVFAHIFPRLDVEVSKHMNHLLKAPFCVHPKTGRVCVPMDATHAEAFDPLGVPTVAKLLNELNDAGARGTGGDVDMVEEYTKTSLAPYIDTFRAWLQPLHADSVADLKRAKEARAAGATDW